MKVIAVIPARWSSVRFEGKVLADINGKPMIQHVWERVKQSKIVDDVIIACDDEKIVEAAKVFGGVAVMTAKDHSSGTDRIAEAIKNIDADIVVNVQGDEPLIESKVVDSLADALLKDSNCKMATVIKEISSPEETENPNVVKVVVDNEGFALYFSRSAIPFNREGENGHKYFKHLGIYAYRKGFLLEYKNLPESKLEKTEKLEQLRALEAGHKIKTIVTDTETIGVDTKEDLQKVEKLLKG